MIVTLIAVAITVSVGICHYYNGDNWNYGFGVLFFGLIPFAGLIEEGLTAALMGYSLGAAMLVIMTLFAYTLEWKATGEWKQPAI